MSRVKRVLITFPSSDKYIPQREYAGIDKCEYLSYPPRRYVGEVEDCRWQSSLLPVERTCILSEIIYQQHGLVQNSPAIRLPSVQ